MTFPRVVQEEVELLGHRGFNLAPANGVKMIITEKRASQRINKQSFRKCAELAP